MKAVYCTQYGGVENLKIVEIEKPVNGKNEILVKVVATTVQTADWRIRTLQMPGGMSFFARLFFGMSKPKQPVLGTELSGTVVEVGDGVNDFKVGDQIIAATGAKLGAHAEYIKIPKGGVIVKKPSSLSFQQAAALPFGGVTALDFLKYRARVQTGDRVLINGASGAVGVAAIQIAKLLGAQVTAVCGVASHDFVKSVGADRVIDYSKTNFWQQKDQYDVIFDVVGKNETSNLLKALNKNGRLVLISAGMGQMLGGAIRNLFSKQKILCGVANETKQMLAELVGLAENGNYQSIIDREFPMHEIAAAHQLVESRHKHGNVVVKF